MPPTLHQRGELLRELARGLRQPPVEPEKVSVALVAVGRGCWLSAVRVALLTAAIATADRRSLRWTDARCMPYVTYMLESS